MILDRAIRNARAMMRSAEWGDSSIPTNGSSGFPTGTGSGNGAESLALSISTVLACLKALYDDTTTIPFAAYQGDPRGAREPIAAQPRIVTEPFGPDEDPRDGFGQLVVSRAARGNWFTYVSHVDPRTGKPDQLVVLHPDAVQVQRKDGRKAFKVGGAWYDSTQILHGKGLTMPGALTGVDVLTAQRVNYDLAMQVTKYADGFFGNGGSPSGVISVKGPGNRTKAREVKEAWEDSHAGVVNAHRPAVLFGGAEWKPLSVTPDNAQFLETRRFLREELCGLYSVPLQRIQAIVENASQGGGKGIDAFDMQYVKHGLLPPAAGIERIWNTLIPGGEATWTLFDFDVFLRANASTRAQIRQINRVTATTTIDEERAAEGKAPLPDGKGSNPFTPLNSNASPTGGADNAPADGGQGGTS